MKYFDRSLIVFHSVTLVCAIGGTLMFLAFSLNSLDDMQSEPENFASSLLGLLMASLVLVNSWLSILAIGSRPSVSKLLVILMMLGALISIVIYFDIWNWVFITVFFINIIAISRIMIPILYTKV